MHQRFYVIKRAPWDRDPGVTYYRAGNGSWTADLDWAARWLTYPPERDQLQSGDQIMLVTIETRMERVFKQP